ncbi:MAG: ABC transporter substrate-binding protein [Neptuniibacter sp.]
MTNLQKILSFLLVVPFSASAMEVTFLNPGKQGERFWDMVTETMQAAADDFDIELEVIYAERNRVKLVELGLQITSRENPPDYLILVNEEQAAERVFKSTVGTEIKTLMLLNDFVPQQRDNVGFPGDKGSNLLGSIVPDNAAAGKRMVKALVDCASDKGKSSPFHMLAIGGDRTTPASIDRNNGALAAVKENNQIKLDRFLYANWNKTEAEKLTSNYLNWASINNISPIGIWAANDPIALGAKEGLIKAGLTAGEDVCLVGLNWSKEGLDMVKNGEMVLTDGGHFLAGAWSMVLLNDYNNQNNSDKREVPGRINFQMQSIDKDNLEKYLHYLGDENWSKVDFTGFSLMAGQGYANYDFSLKNAFRHITQQTD